MVTPVNQNQVSNYYDQIAALFKQAENEAQKAGLDTTKPDEYVPQASASDATKTAKKKYTADEIDALVKRYNELAETFQSQIDALNEVITKLQTQLQEEQAVYDDLSDKYKAKKSQYDELESRYEAKAEEYSYIEGLVERATERAEAEAKQDQQNAIYAAMANYDEERDGDYQTYMANSLEGVVDESSISAFVESLASQSSSLLSELGSLKLNMFSVSSEMNSAKRKMDAQGIIVNDLTSNLTAKNTEKTNLENTMQSMQAELANIALDSISDEEKALVKDNNIDLTEKFPDGSPKYIIARGRSDNKYHIYEMDEQGGCSATSLARKYGNNKGFDIVANGNGYMRNIKRDCEQNICNTVFSFDCVSDDLSSGKANAGKMDYCTCSPLSFDLENDGITTSDEIIQYDIDGDGILDKINNSADAVLVFDADGDGVSGEDGKECFGNNTDLDGDGVKDGFSDGFAALKALAKKENLINGTDDNKLDANDIKTLEEKYGFKIKLEGYDDVAISLLDIGITEIDLSTSDKTNLQKNFDGKQNDIMTQEGATFTINGEKHEYADIWHQKLDFKV